MFLYSVILTEHAAIEPRVRVCLSLCVTCVSVYVIFTFNTDGPIFYKTFYKIISRIFAIAILRGL